MFSAFEMDLHNAQSFVHRDFRIANGERIGVRGAYSNFGKCGPVRWCGLHKSLQPTPASLLRTSAQT